MEEACSGALDAGPTSRRFLQQKLEGVERQKDSLLIAGGDSKILSGAVFVMSP